MVVSVSAPGVARARGIATSPRAVMNRWNVGAACRILVPSPRGATSRGDACRDSIHLIHLHCLRSRFRESLRLPRLWTVVPVSAPRVVRARGVITSPRDGMNNGAAGHILVPSPRVATSRGDACRDSIHLIHLHCSRSRFPEPLRLPRLWTVVPVSAPGVARARGVVPSPRDVLNKWYDGAACRILVSAPRVATSPGDALQKTIHPDSVSQLTIRSPRASRATGVRTFALVPSPGGVRSRGDLTPPSTIFLVQRHTHRTLLLHASFSDLCRGRLYRSRELYQHPGSPLVDSVPAARSITTPDPSSPLRQLLNASTPMPTTTARVAAARGDVRAPRDLSINGLFRRRWQWSCTCFPHTPSRDESMAPDIIFARRGS